MQTSRDLGGSVLGRALVYRFVLYSRSARETSSPKKRKGQER